MLIFVEEAIKKNRRSPRKAHIVTEKSLDGSEAGVDLVLIQTSLLLLCKTNCSDAN